MNMLIFLLNLNKIEKKSMHCFIIFSKNETKQNKKKRQKAKFFFDKYTSRTTLMRINLNIYLVFKFLFKFNYIFVIQYI